MIHDPNENRMTHADRVERYGDPENWKFKLHRNMDVALDADYAFLLRNYPTLRLALDLPPERPEKPFPVLGWPDGRVELIDGGRFPDVEAAVAYMRLMIEQRRRSDPSIPEIREVEIEEDDD